MWAAGLPLLRRYLWLMLVCLSLATMSAYVVYISWQQQPTPREKSMSSKGNAHVPGAEEYRRLEALVLEQNKPVQQLGREPAAAIGTSSQGNASRSAGNALAHLLHMRQPAAFAGAKVGNGDGGGGGRALEGGHISGGGKQVGALESMLSGSAVKPYRHPDLPQWHTQAKQGKLPLCSHPDLGQANVKVDLETVPEDEELTRLSKNVEPGGHWRPAECVPDQKLAIVIPFRSRELHLRFFLKYIHRFLQQQQLYYNVYVVDQNDGSPFNRASLFNVGFVEALYDDNFTCFVFHDVDHIPVDDLLSYRCGAMPMHMAAMIDKWEWGIPYRQFTGGVTMQSTEHMLATNGFANTYWGWGGEDDDVKERWIYAGMHFKRPTGGHGRYATIKTNHTQSSVPNPQRMQLLKTSRQRVPYDGLNTLHYKLVSKTRHALYTRLKVLIKRIGLR